MPLVAAGLPTRTPRRARIGFRVTPPWKHPDVTRRGIAPERIRIVHAPGVAPYMAELSSIDILLDPFPYNGGTVTMEAFWMGVPVITLMGESYLSRVGASLYRQVGLDDALVAENEADYVNKAVGLAGTPVELAQYHATLRDLMMSSTIGDTGAFAEDFLAALGGIRRAASTRRE